MTLDVSIQGMRRAAAIGVSAACREAGRTLFYRWQQRFEFAKAWMDCIAALARSAGPGPATAASGR
jgi:hypothetical protein